MGLSLRRPIGECLPARAALLAILFVALLGVLFLAPTAAAQTAQTVNLRIDANYAIAVFYVDGKEYTGNASFVWPAGSKHTLEVRALSQMLNEGRSRLAFQSFSDPGSLILTPASPTQIYTATSDISSIQIQFLLEHKAELYINTEPLQNLADPLSDGFSPIQLLELPQRASQTGYLVTSNNLVLCGTDRPGVPTSMWTWFTDGTTVGINAIPYPGYAFAGWYSESGTDDPYAATWNVNAPLKLHAKLVEARRVVVDSYPVKELKVVVDQNTIYTRGDVCQPDNGPQYSPSDTTLQLPAGSQSPANYGYCTQIPLCNGELDLAPDTQHTFAAPGAQTDTQGRLWVFDHFEFNTGQTGGQNTVFTVPQSSGAYYAGAYFVKGVKASIVTVPGNLKVKVDGRDNWQSFVFSWGVGHKHTVSAPPELVDAKGRRYRFVAWSNGGPADQEITVDDYSSANPGSFWLTATYELLGQVTIKSEPTGVTISAGGADCVTPCTLDRPIGATVNLLAASEFALTEDSKALFDAWTDGPQAPGRVYTFGTGASVLTARYRTLNKLTTYSDPENSVNWLFDPKPEAGGFYSSGTRVQVTAEAKTGYKFKRFEGNLTGSYNIGTVTMSAPAYVAAHMQKVAALDENSVRNAAGETPDKVVAPGSLIAIQGANLVAQAQVGPESPLAQTLQGVLVQLSGRFLPLVYVTPETIVAQLPSDVAVGDQTLTVKSATQPSVSAKFTVARNAPGLFRQPDATDDVPLALAYHADGTLVTKAAPAKVGETVSLFATGLGPTNPAWLDGFAVPSSPAMATKDTCELWSGGLVRKLTFAGLAPGRVGYWLVKFPVDAAWGSAQLADITVKVGGRTSNRVVLPLQ